MTYFERSAHRVHRGANTDDRLAELLRGRELVVASNRQPYRHGTDEDGDLHVDRPTGGLTAGLDPVMRQTGGTWVAWGDGERDYEVVDGWGHVWVPPDDPTYRLKRLRLSEEAVSGYYYGYSNQVLWPVCHSALTEVNGGAGYWGHYRDVNERFAEAIADVADERSIVWFQDYHLALAPKLVRPLIHSDAVLMHFWHIPWPSWDTFRACAQRRELIEGLLGNDVVGFHTSRYRTNFLGCVDAALGEATVDWQAGTVTYRGESTSVEAVPMGVPADRIHRSTTTPTAEGFWQSFAREHGLAGGRRVAVGVDRLDYTKGIVERLQALERLWEAYPGWHGEITYVQNGSESRSAIPVYRELQETVADAVERINNRFGTDDWQPIVPINDHLSREELYGLYRHADLALVTPIRDGMNLVAQEFVAAQRSGDGVLVLSDQAGIHDELGDYAVTISPSDVDGLADSIVRALTMPAAERRHRMMHLEHRVRTMDLDAWLLANLRSAIETVADTTRSTSRWISTS